MTGVQFGKAAARGGRLADTQIPEIKLMFIRALILFLPAATQRSLKATWLDWFF